jgi:hypothetical protein
VRKPGMTSNANNVSVMLVAGCINGLLWHS